MDETLASLKQAFERYREEIEAYERKSKPTDGLLGFGRSLKDDACHERFDERVAQAVREMCAAQPAPDTAERAVRLLILRGDAADWPTAAQWMFRAVERHCVPLIPFLTPGAAAVLYGEYAERYRPWDRLPAQKDVLKALKKAC